MSGGRLLIVDADEHLVHAVKPYLEREEYACTVVADGPAAFDTAAAESPDLIILDRVLPTMSGDELARRLQADVRTASIPLVFVTGKDPAENPVVGVNFDAADYIRKPFSINLLLVRIAAHLNRPVAV